MKNFTFKIVSIISTVRRGRKERCELQSGVDREESSMLWGSASLWSAHVTSFFKPWSHRMYTLYMYHVYYNILYTIAHNLHFTYYIYYLIKYFKILLS